LTSKTSRIAVRLLKTDAALLKHVCRSRGEDVSDFVRRAIRTELAKLSFLNPIDKKALGIPVRENRDDV